MRATVPAIILTATLVLLLGPSAIARSTAQWTPITSGIATGSTSPAARTSAQSEKPEGWERVDVGGAFTIALPPGWAYEPREGIDSFVGAFVGPEVELGFDYGQYSNPLPEPGEPGYIGHYTRISCKVAKLVTAIEAPANITGVYFPEVSNWIVPGIPEDFFRMKLDISGQDLDPTQRALALRIFETVHFPDHCLQTERGEWEILPAPQDVLPVDVAFHGTKDGWIVGLDDATRHEGSQEVGCAAARFDAGAWARVPCPASDMLWGLSLTDADDGWAVGGSSILRLQGGTWSTISDTVGFVLFDVLADGADSGWAVGLNGLLRLADGAWQPVATQPQVQGLTIAQRAADEAYAGGAHQLFRWDGLAWREIPSPVRDLPASATIHDLVPEGGERGWFVGAIDNTDTGIVWRRGEGGEVDWTTFPDTGALWDIEVIANDNELGRRAWAVGGDPNPSPAAILEFDGDTWHAHHTPFGGTLRAIDMPSPYEGWAVGQRIDRIVDGVAQMSGVAMHYRAYTERPPLVTAPPPTPSASPTPTAVPHTAFLPWAMRDTAPAATATGNIAP